MMKFRIWDGRLDQMIYPTDEESEEYRLKLDGRVVEEEKWNFGWTRYTGCIAMLYTGKTDSSSREIYEDDIYKYKDSDILFVVEWDECTSGFVASNTKEPSNIDVPFCDSAFSGDFDRVWDPTMVEVVGNRYENPELLDP